jgi:diaminohydroxyphosphoribosylaminopyrimidine deaminase/5-amino-6-(5-phosphoribosylamino)uracil reductase
MTSEDVHFMRHALRLAERHLGRTWPNPSVGALVVKEGRILGAGVTGPGGRPHAEPQALRMAGGLARGATLYVTLEPCSHHGKTPPCAEAVIAAGVRRVVIGCGDSDTRVAGRGMAALRAAGVEVTNNVCEAEAYASHAGFFSRLERNRPFAALKLATSLDGMIADQQAKSQWITGEPARAYGQFLRGRYDAILTGIGTVLADDPKLTCRLPGRAEDSPLRVIADRRLQTPPASACLPAWIFTDAASLEGERANALAAAGATLIATPLKNAHLDLADIFAQLAARGVTRLLVEGGQGIASAALDARLIDRLYWFRAPFAIGAGGREALDVSFLPLPERPRFALIESRALGADRLDVFTACQVVLAAPERDAI